MFCTLILLLYVKNNIYNMTHNNSNTSFDNSESETKLLDFSTVNPFDMEIKTKVSYKNFTQY